MVENLAIEPRSGFGLATVMARRDADPKAIGTALGVAPPDGPRWTEHGSLALIGAGPGSWFALSAAPEPDWLESLRDDLAGLASVSDQSSGYAMWRLSGEGARRLLQRGVSIDLHPQNFAAGSAATTVIAHIGVIIRQLDDTPTYDLAVFRSFAGSLSHWIESTAAAVRSTIAHEVLP